MVPAFPSGNHIPNFRVPSPFKQGKKRIHLDYTSFSIKIQLLGPVHDSISKQPEMLVFPCRGG